MEFDFRVSRLLRDPITVVGSTFRRSLPSKLRQHLNTIVDKMGKASAKAQALPAVITTASKIEGTDHVLYLGASGSSKCSGLLKVGYKNLFIRDHTGAIKEIRPLCVLDFYVHESCQRTGIGKKLFQRMLQVQNVEPKQLGYDRPSPKLLGFLRKHYNLTRYTPQNNNYVVFKDYFQNSSGPSSRRGSRKRNGPIKPATPRDSAWQGTENLPTFGGGYGDGGYGDGHGHGNGGDDGDHPDGSHGGCGNSDDHKTNTQAMSDNPNNPNENGDPNAPEAGERREEGGGRREREVRGERAAESLGRQYYLAQSSSRQALLARAGATPRSRSRPRKIDNEMQRDGSSVPVRMGMAYRAPRSRRSPLGSLGSRGRSSGAASAPNSADPSPEPRSPLSTRNGDGSEPTRRRENRNDGEHYQGRRGYERERSSSRPSSRPSSRSSSRERERVGGYTPSQYNCEGGGQINGTQTASLPLSRNKDSNSCPSMNMHGNYGKTLPEPAPSLPPVHGKPRRQTRRDPGYMPAHMSRPF